MSVTASFHSQPRAQSGRLVALEGDVDTIATQLRILPPSQKILLLPSLIDQLPHDVDAQAFTARTFIRNTHTAFVERTERARSFLQSSTTTQPRIVFINGGSVAARTACISKICENITNGDVKEADIIFNDIVKDGVAGLMRDDPIEEEQVGIDEEEEVDDVERDAAQETPEMVEDPSSKAMKAAETLDRETAELQEDQVDDHALVSNELSTHEVYEAQDEDFKAKEEVFTSEEGDDIVRTAVTVPGKAGHTQKMRSTFGFGRPTSPTAPFVSTTNYKTSLPQQPEDDDDYDSDDESTPDLTSPGDDTLHSIPTTPAVVYGEACVVSLQTTPRKTTRKVKSLDRFYPSGAGYADWDSGSRSLLKHARSAYHLGRPGTSSGRIQGDYYDGFKTLPRTSFVRASTTTIKKASFSSSSSLSSVSTPKVRVYVDRGNDAEDVPVEDVVEEEAAPFEPVFPVVEDLVIHFTHDHPSDIFEHVLSEYKNGNYPIFPSLEPDSSPPASPSNTNEEHQSIRPTSHLTTETDDEGFHRRHEIDPYATNNYPGGVNQWRMKDAEEQNSARDLKPPTPSLTPPPTARSSPEKFFEFSPMNPNSVIGIQNSLRSLFNLHFPAGKDGYTQYYYPVSPETERLWKPVFRNDETSSIGNEGRTVDQIIALGCDEGVKTEFSSQVSGKIERFGMKSDGSNRSSKIDLRYFISNVMQMHSNLPSSIQSTFNPVSTPEVLAAYIVPYIEAYLAINTNARLLILQFPSSHLATIIALRKILGQDVLKIAGIMNSMSSDLPSITSRSRPRTPKANPLSNEATSKPTRSPISSQRNISINSKELESGVSFSKANFLLPSVATDSEISTFLSAIRKNLIEISAFYTPEPEPKPILIEKPPQPPTPATPNLSSREPSNPPISYRQNPSSRESKVARLTGNPSLTSSAVPPRTPTGGKGHKYAGSVASTVRTTNSERFKREEARIEREWENFYIGEEDSEDDDYDRMMLGRSLARIVPEVKVVASDGQTPRRSTKKALKWLGLA